MASSKLTKTVLLFILVNFWNIICSKTDKVQVHYHPKLINEVKASGLLNMKLTLSYFAQGPILQLFSMNFMEQFQMKVLGNVVRFDHRQEFKYEDGGTIHLDWKWAKGVADVGLETPLGDDKPIMMLVPGQGNDSNDIYMQNQTRACAEAGFHVVCVGPRGMQGVEKFTSHLIRCPGRDSDIRDVLDSIYAKFSKGTGAKPR